MSIFELCSQLPVFLALGLCFAAPLSQNVPTLCSPCHPVLFRRHPGLCFAAPLS